MSKYFAVLKNLFISVFSNNENIGLSSLTKTNVTESNTTLGNKDIKFSDILK